MLQKLWRPALLMVLLVTAAILFDPPGANNGLSHYLNTDYLRQTMKSYGHAAALGLVLVYACCITVALPTLPFQLLAGAVYGPWLGFLLMFIGANIGALGAFTVARRLGRKTVESLAARYFPNTGKASKLHSWGAKLDKGGFRYLLLLRLTPFMPFNLINYASGISRVHLRHFVLANLLGCIPLTFIFVYLGVAAGRL